MKIIVSGTISNKLRKQESHSQSPYKIYGALTLQL